MFDGRFVRSRWSQVNQVSERIAEVEKEAAAAANLRGESAT